jgi:hypothetical protein
VFSEFGLIELCRLNLFKFRIKVLKIKRKLNSPPSWAINPYNRRGSRGTNEEVEALSLSMDWDLGVGEAGGVIRVLDACLEVVAQVAQRLSTSTESRAERLTSSSWRRTIERMKNSGSRSI